MTEDRQIPRLSLVTLWLGITGLVLSLAGIGFLVAIPAVICGHLALLKIKTRQISARGRGAVITGLVTAYLGTVLGVGIMTSSIVRTATVIAQHPNLFRRERLVPATQAEVATLRQDQKMWIWATCALITESNWERHDLLGGVEPTPGEIEKQKRALREWWSVHDRQSLLDTLKWLAREGHRRDFEDLGARIQSLSPEQLQIMKDRVKQDPKLSHKIGVVEKYYAEVGPKSIYGWDYGRYVALCGWGYLVGYFTEEEAWQRALPAARKLQATFSSWEDLGSNYLVGREFWSLKHTQKTGARYRKSYNKLTTNSASPWKRYPWNLPLANPPQS